MTMHYLIINRITNTFCEFTRESGKSNSIIHSFALAKEKIPLVKFTRGILYWKNTVRFVELRSMKAGIIFPSFYLS